MFQECFLAGKEIVRAPEFDKSSNYALKSRQTRYKYPFLMPHRPCKALAGSCSRSNIPHRQGKKEVFLTVCATGNVTL
jgi:hypothetical protein